MSQKLTVQSLIDAGVPSRVGNICPTDSRFYAYINSFEERALSYGRWWGTTQLMQFCATPTSNRGVCVVLPREVAVVEAVTLNGQPIQSKNEWFSFVKPHLPWQQWGNGGGSGCGNGGFGSNTPCVGNIPCGCGCGCTYALTEDQLTVPSFSTTLTGQKIRFYFDPVDVGRTILVQGYDENNIWVRTLVGGVWTDGELVTLATTGGEYYTDTSTAWYVGSPTGIQKQTTNKRVLMFAVDSPFASGNATQQLAMYQPGETLPEYRKLFIPGVRVGGGACCNRASVKCIVSLAKIPVSVPTDWLLFQNVSCYLDGIKSEVLRDNNDITGSDRFFFGGDEPSRNGRGVIRVNKLGGALPTLQAELRKMTGDRSTVAMQRDGLYLQAFV